MEEEVDDKVGEEEEELVLLEELELVPFSDSDKLFSVTTAEKEIQKASGFLDFLCFIFMRFTYDFFNRVGIC